MFVSVWPLLLSFFIGSEREMTLTVYERTSIYRGCSHAVKFENLSRWNNALCNIPRDIRDQLSRCDKVTVSGFGTDLGIRVQNIVAVSPAHLPKKPSAFENCPD